MLSRFSSTALVGAAMFALGALLSPGLGAVSAQPGAPPDCVAVTPAPGDPIVVKGTGQSASAPFTLAGGAYTVDWVTDAPTTALSFMRLASANDPSVLRSETVVNGAAGTSGQTHVYNLKPGPYYLDVRAPSGWSVTLTPLAV